MISRLVSILRLRPKPMRVKWCSILRRAFWNGLPWLRKWNKNKTNQTLWLQLVFSLLGARFKFISIVYYCSQVTTPLIGISGLCPWSLLNPFIAAIVDCVSTLVTAVVSCHVLSVHCFVVKLIERRHFPNNLFFRFLLRDNLYLSVFFTDQFVCSHSSASLYIKMATSVVC